MKATNIRVMADTKKEFDSCGLYGDSADSILKRLVVFYKKYHNSKGEVVDESLSLFSDLKDKVK